MIKAFHIAVLHIRFGSNMKESKKRLRFEIFNMNKTGVINMSVAFHSHITHKNWPKTEQAMQKRYYIRLFCRLSYVIRTLYTLMQVFSCV